MAKGIQRKLSAVFAADVVGYSRLMGADETGTLSALKDILEDIVKPLLDEHQGRLVKLMGDGVLAEFSSVVDAVNCAVAIQAATEKHAAAIPEDGRIRFRIGVNIGDIIIEGDDIFGDGVNIAARLEGLSDPGGVCVSRTVVDHVGERAGIAFEDLGEIEVKNMATKVHAFRVVPIGTAPPRKPRQTSRRVSNARLVLGSLAIIAALVGWWMLQPDFTPVDPADMAAPLPDGPSIAVLPFEFLGADPDNNDYLADGLSENIISALARLPNATVIARSSTFIFKGKPVDVRDIAKQFGVRYVLEGSVQLSGDTIRVTAQLIDGIEGNNVWTKTYDRAVAGIFDVQDEIALSVSERFYGQAISGNTTGSSWGTKNLEAWSEAVQGFEALNQNTPEALKIAKRRFEKSIELDPDFAAPYGGLSFYFFFFARYGWTDDPAAVLAKGVELARKAIELAPDYTFGYSALAYNRLIQGQADAALTAAGTSVEKSPGSGFDQATMGFMLLYTGDARGALSFFERAKRIYVVTPWWVDANVCAALTDLGEYEAAIEACRNTLPRTPPPFKADFLLNFAAAHYGAGNEGEARRITAEALAMNPDLSIDRSRFWDLPYVDKSIPESRYWLLRDLGIPETAPSGN